MTPPSRRRIPKTRGRELFPAPAFRALGGWLGDDDDEDNVPLAQRYAGVVTSAGADAVGVAPDEEEKELDMHPH